MALSAKIEVTKPKTIGGFGSRRFNSGCLMNHGDSLTANSDQDQVLKIRTHGFVYFLYNSDQLNCDKKMTD